MYNVYIYTYAYIYIYIHTYIYSIYIYILYIYIYIYILLESPPHDLRTSLPESPLRSTEAQLALSSHRSNCTCKLPRGQE